MGTTIAINDNIVELYNTVKTGYDEEKYPKVIQITLGENVSIHTSTWPIHSNYGRELFLAPSELWEEINKYLKDIEDFIENSLQVAPKSETSNCYIWYCDDGYMYWGDYKKRPLNWLTYIPEHRNIIVGRHHRKDNCQSDIEQGIRDGSVIPISEAYMDFILFTLSKRIKLIADFIRKIYTPR